VTGRRGVTGRPGAPGGRANLERAYRRLLRWYPAGHRTRHADEMLGVLMDGAGSGRRRPALADSANLIGGALRIRLRAATTGSAGLWRDALSRAGRLLPLAWVALVLAFFVPGQVSYWMTDGVAAVLGPSELLADAQVYLPLVIVAVTVLLGRRWLALAAIAATVILNAHVLGLTSLPAFRPDAAAELAVLGIAALALIVTPGRARPVLTWQHYLLTAVVAAAAGVADLRQDYLAEKLSLPGHPVPASWSAAELTGLGLVAAVTIVLLAWSAASRRLLIVAAVPLYFYAALLATPDGQAPSPLIYLPLAALAAAAVLLVISRARARRLSVSDG
jgi:hypothetical protein